MDKYSVCADFLPGIDEETLDTSFIHEAIEKYTCLSNERLVDEAFKDVVSSLVDKIKSGAKSVWKKISGAASKVFSEHFSKKNKKNATNESAVIDEDIEMVFGKSGVTEGTTAKDYIDGLYIGCEVIYRNLSNTEAVYDAAEKAFDSVNGDKDVINAMKQFKGDIVKCGKKTMEMKDALAKKYRIPRTNSKGEKVSQLSYAGELMTDIARAQLSPKDGEAIAKLLTKTWNRLIPYYNKLFARGVAEDCTIFKKYQATCGKLSEDRVKFLDPISSEMGYYYDDMMYTKNDIYFMADKLNAAISALRENIQESIGPRSVYYRLGESEVYKYCRNQETVDGAKLESNITRMVRDGYGFTFVGYDDLDKTVQYEIFESNQYFNVGVSGAKKAVKNLIMSGKVQMVYSDTYMVDVSIPYIITTGRNPRVFVNISHFVSPNQFGKYVVTQVRNKNALISALFAACVSYAIVSHYHTLNPDIGDPLVLMHAYMLTDVLDRMVHMDAIMKDKVRYLCTQFALVQMYGTEVGTKTFQRFRGKYFPKLSNMLMNSVDSQFTVDAFDNIQLFIDEIVRVYPSMKKVTFKDVWKTWYRRYSNTAIMALDYIGYMIYILCELLYESPLVNRLALDPMLKAARGELALKTLQTMVASVG